MGVGFSYADTDEEYETGDDQAAKDNYQTILQFLKRFPQFDQNLIYISSESYGGFKNQ